MKAWGVVAIVAAVVLGVVGLVLLGSASWEMQPRVGIVHVDGVLVTQAGAFADGVVSSQYLVSTIDTLASDRNTKAIILDINSPGGSGVASDEVARAIRRVQKPVVAVIRESGASGAYWIASAADTIYANRLSTVGSIGVRASYLDFSGLLDDYNVTYQRFVAGDHKDFGSPFRSPTANESARFQKMLDELHEIFITEVAEGRNLSIEYVRGLADGFIYTGSEALNLGLVDVIGDREDALAALEADLGNLVQVEYREQHSWLSALGGFLQDKTPVLEIPKRSTPQVVIMT